VPSPIALSLAPSADAAWVEVVRPWLEAGKGRLERSFVVVPTRGQAHLFKQRCLLEGFPLLGVEFLTPGLARKKWLALGGEPVPALGRELLLLGLRGIIAEELAARSPGEPGWGVLTTLASDPERALDDFDEMLKAGLGATNFPRPLLATVFAALTDWVHAVGATLAPAQSKAAALTPLRSNDAKIAGRLLVIGLTAESWGEFFNVVALVRRMAAVAVVLPAPAFRGRAACDEKWVDVWQSILGVEAEPLDDAGQELSCAAVGELWTKEGGSAEGVRVIVGQTRRDEMGLVADEIERLIATGAENIGVVFPQADAAHVRLVRDLTVRGVPFADLLEVAAPPPIDVRIQRALLAFYERGARLDELLGLWPLLRITGAVDQSLGAARDVCERWFDEGQNHTLAHYRERWQGSERPAWQEVARVAAILLPPWPGHLTLGDALQRFESVCEQLEVELVSGWSALKQFATRTTDTFPLAVVMATLSSFLPEKSAVAAAGRSCFARVTLTTRRRAEGLAWSHLIFVESNAGVWPVRREPSCWLTDVDREGLKLTGPYSLSVFTGEDRASMERQSYASLARDTREGIVFSAALFDDDEPERVRAPNAWLERVLWSQGRADAPGGLEKAFQALAVEHCRSEDGSPPTEWLAVWHARRDPRQKFDDFFFAGDPAVTRPEKLAARVIERGVQDPAELWFTAVLQTARVPWEPLVRQKAKTMGQLVHRVMASTLRPREPRPSGFGELASRSESEAALAARLAHARSRWPADYYWDSFHAELSTICRELLSEVYACEAGEFVATELKLPASAVVKIGEVEVPVVGRMDLVRADRAEWRGATVDVVDFKTGVDAKLSAKRMGKTGDSLQLGIYLEAARSLGIANGRVWMLKPQADGATQLNLDDLPEALVRLRWLAVFLETGIYGALTPDRSAFGFSEVAWPLACVLVPYAVLQEKFATTFGAEEGEESDE